MSVFIFPDSRFLPWRLLAFWKTYQLRSHGITELTFRCYSLNKYYPDLCFEGCAPFAQAPFNLKTLLCKATWWHQDPEAGKMKAESSKALLRQAQQALECQRHAESNGTFSLLLTHGTSVQLLLWGTKDKASFSETPGQTLLCCLKDLNSRDS